MYARYSRTRSGTDAIRYQFQEQVSLFGCNNGYIPWLLGLKTPAAQAEPYRWHVSVVQELGSHPDYLNSTLIIDLKPKQNPTNLSLYEVLDVWGYSFAGWSPILIRLSGLFVDEDPGAIDRNDFARQDSEVDPPIYGFLYLDGSVRDGKLVGTWRTPPVSATNAVLLWPEPLIILCTVHSGAHTRRLEAMTRKHARHRSEQPPRRTSQGLLNRLRVCTRISGVCNPLSNHTRAVSIVLISRERSDFLSKINLGQ